MTEKTQLKAVIFDWAGTLIDQGSCAPAAAFVQAFAQHGIEISLAEARGPMGMPKRDHIKTLLLEPQIAERCSTGAGPLSDALVDEIYQSFLPINEQIALDYATLIDGALETLTWLQQRGIKIGTTTGYTRSIMAGVLPLVKAQGFEPDSLVCSDEVPSGRPGPLAMYQSMINLDVWPVGSVMKVDDTGPGLAEGLSAGCPTVGLTLSGNACALSQAELEALVPAEKLELHREAEQEIKAAGAEFVIPSVASLPRLIEEEFSL